MEFSSIYMATDFMPAPLQPDYRTHSTLPKTRHQRQISNDKYRDHSGDGGSGGTCGEISL